MKKALHILLMLVLFATAASVSTAQIQQSGKVTKPTKTGKTTGQNGGKKQPKVQLSPLEKLFVGKHLFGDFCLDDASGRFYSTLTITKQADGRLRCQGTQRVKHFGEKHYCIMDGYIEIINEDKFIFIGKIKHNNGMEDKPIDRVDSGRFCFVRSENGAYWHDTPYKYHDPDPETGEIYAVYEGCTLGIFTKIMK